MHLLIVDDDDITCRGFQRRIMSLRLAAIDSVQTAFSAEEALKVLENRPIDGMITDIQMVDMDGLELIAKVRQRREAMPCAIISAHDRFEYAQQAIRLGVEDFLLKPCDIDELRNVVEKLIRKVDAQSMPGGQDGAANESADSPGETSLHEKNNAVAWAIDYARQSFDKDITMATVANELDMNYSYFSRLFKKETGKTFSEFMLEVKMQEAGKMLLRGCRINQIADDLGYCTTQNFTRAFTKFWGMTTREFRKR